MTPHIGAKKSEIAKIVLMSGDPLRAKYFANKYLTKPKLVSTVRNMLIYTGTLNNQKITVMGHGMGFSSIGIYAYELYKFYDVKTIIRFGSGGAYVKELNLFDILIAPEAYSESNYGEGFNEFNRLVKIKQHRLLTLSKELINRHQADFKHKILIGTVHSSEWFYKETKLIDINQLVATQKCLAVEMELTALYSIANFFNREAIGIITISDNLITKEDLLPKEREQAFEETFKLLILLINSL